MARKTFISYKYSEAQDTRDRIIRALGSDAQYYQGETSASPNQADLKTETIKRNLSHMIYGTSVMIVVISPNMRQSAWIDWELEYCLKAMSRDGRISQSNGVVGVVQGELDDWLDQLFRKSESRWKQCASDLILLNQDNRTVPYELHEALSADLFKSYISCVSEATFLNSPNVFIENAYEKSQSLNKYNIRKQV